ncbi:MAG: RhuM family protein [bacterium]|nr:RhuM family protein [bacterium]
MDELKKGEIIIYKDKKAEIEVRLENETVWLTQAQMADLFQKDVRTISEHIRNVYSEGELKEPDTVYKSGNSGIGLTKPTSYYNLDVIISVGYRVKSVQGTQFRIWATRILREHIVQGFTVNQKRLQETGLQDFEKVLALVRDTIAKKELTGFEARGLLRVITDYSNTWLLLQKYDEGMLAVECVRKKIEYAITYADALAAIAELKKDLMAKKEAGDLFGVEREHLAGIIGNINQSFGGQALYPSVEEKAAHLLYFVIKDHPFGDGNKRIGSLLFIIFLARNNHLFTKKGERKISDNALVALALLVAESRPNQKDTMIKLTVNFLKG